ncbi:MAG TPA: extensin family protein [Roseiarcus sp.]|nr:extensin family protein [Roseiarcus sp.]
MTAPSIPRARCLVLAALALGVSAASVRAVADEPPLPPPRPPELGASEKAPAEPSPPAPIGGAAPACLAKLTADGASAEAATAPPASAEGCGIDAPVRLSSIMADGGAVSLPDHPLVTCEFAAVLADYVRLIVAPLGQSTLHAKVAAIETGPGYDCRTQDRIAGAKISAHAKGLAVDFVAITLADKRRILVERQTGADEASYFRAIRTAACGWFTTVLGPGADAFHANNMHLDIEQHGSSGSYRICQ